MGTKAIMKIGTAIEDVQGAEEELAKQLRVTGERHAVDHDVYHMGHTLARKCAEHIEKLRQHAERYGSPAGDASAATSPALMEALRHKASEMLGRSEMTGMLLLSDLRALYVTAQRAEIAWVILLQAAKAARDQPLVEVATSCHEEAEAGAKWVKTRIKVTAPQVLAAG